jgi:PH and SEC7 domain-containing protein
VARLESELDDHRKHAPERGAKALTMQNHKEKDAFLQYEVVESILIFILQ